MTATNDTAEIALARKSPSTGRDEIITLSVVLNAGHVDWSVLAVVRDAESGRELRGHKYAKTLHRDAAEWERDEIVRQCREAGWK